MLFERVCAKYYKWGAECFADGHISKLQQQTLQLLEMFRLTITLDLIKIAFSSLDATALNTKAVVRRYSSQ